MLILSKKTGGLFCIQCSNIEINAVKIKNIFWSLKCLFCTVGEIRFGCCPSGCVFIEIFAWRYLLHIPGTQILIERRSFAKHVRHIHYLTQILTSYILIEIRSSGKHTPHLCYLTHIPKAERSLIDRLIMASSWKIGRNVFLAECFQAFRISILYLPLVKKSDIEPFIYRIFNENEF